MLTQSISLSRDLKHPTECDRCILNLLNFQLIQGDKNNPFKQIFEQLGVIILALDGQIHFMTQKTEQLLSHYFSSFSSNSLPKPLQYWFKHQMMQLQTNSTTTSPYLPLHIEQSDKKLVIRLISNSTREQYLLLLEEEETQSFSVSSLELLGLTKREAEVLFWIAKDKSNAEIAKMLGCCEGTVRKHLEHLYGKLGVQTRMGAVMMALEKLGLLKG